MTDEEEMAKLKDVYDELWRDAKTMVKDMRRSITMYFFSGCITLALTFLYAWYAIIGVLSMLAGSNSYLTYFLAFFGVFGTILFVLVGIIFLRLYFKLRKRYAKLMGMEKKLEG